MNFKFKLGEGPVYFDGVDEHLGEPGAGEGLLRACRSVQHGYTRHQTCIQARRNNSSQSSIDRTRRSYVPGA